MMTNFDKHMPDCMMLPRMSDSYELKPCVN